MEKEGEDKLVLVINYIHNIYACKKHEDYKEVSILPSVTPIEFKGYYFKHANRIDKVISLNVKETIIQMLSVSPLNLLEIKKILGSSYSTIRQHVKDLVNLKIVDFLKVKEGKRVEKRAVLHKNVEVIPITELKNRFDEELIKSKREKEKFKDDLNKEIQNLVNIKTIKVSQPKKKKTKNR